MSSFGGLPALAVSRSLLAVPGLGTTAGSGLTVSPVTIGGDELRSPRSTDEVDASAWLPVTGRSGSRRANCTMATIEATPPTTKSNGVQLVRRLEFLYFCRMAKFVRGDAVGSGWGRGEVGAMGSVGGSWLGFLIMALADARL